MSKIAYNIRKDYLRLCENWSWINFIKYAIVNKSMRLSVWFRIASTLRYKATKSFLYVPLWVICECIYRFFALLAGVDVSTKATIGGGILFSHTFGIVISHSAVVGENLRLYQGVTIGATRDGEAGNRSPIIGNNVTIAAGAKVIGGITIGDNVMIGANAVVNRNVPSGAVVAGIPATIISMKGTEYAKLYRKV